MITHQQQIVLAALSKADLSVTDLRSRHYAPQTATSLVRLGMAVRRVEQGRYCITEKGRGALTKALARVGGVQGGTEYEPHPYESGIRRDDLGRGMCAICGRLGGARVHVGLNDQGVWS